MKKLLIVVDYQVDFVTGSLGFPKALTLDEKIVSKIKEFDENGDDVLFTLDTHYDNYFDTIEGKNLPIKHCIFNTEGHKIYGLVREMVGNHPLILKETFGSKELFDYLKDKEYSEVYFCGVVTNICVISNAVVVKSLLPNANIIIYKELVASNDEEMEKMSFEIMKNLHMQII